MSDPQHRLYVSIPSWSDTPTSVSLLPYWAHEVQWDRTYVNPPAKLRMRFCVRCWKPILPNRDKTLARAAHASHFWELFHTVLWRRR